MFALAEKLYGNAEFVEERHRHRYEVNDYVSHVIVSDNIVFVYL